jgi:ferrous iron transport protein A
MRGSTKFKPLGEILYLQFTCNTAMEKNLSTLTGASAASILELTNMQVSVNSATHRERSLAELPAGQAGVLEKLEVPDDIRRRLMELGFLPGHVVTPAHSAPGGDPRVFRVDGSEIALRRETAQRLWVRPIVAAVD